MLNHLLDLPDDLMLSDHEVGVLEEATRDEAAHRLCNNPQLLWEALGPDALPRDERLAVDLEREIAFCVVNAHYEKLGCLQAWQCPTPTAPLKMKSMTTGLLTLD